MFIKVHYCIISWSWMFVVCFAPNRDVWISLQTSQFVERFQKQNKKKKILKFNVFQTSSPAWMSSKWTCRWMLAALGAHNGVLKYVTCRPPLHAGNRIEDPGGQGSVGDRLGSVASTFLVGDSGFSGACVTQLSATAATAMLREGSGKQRAVTLASEWKKGRLAGREKETESNGKGKSPWASFVLKKSILER